MSLPFHLPIALLLALVLAASPATPGVGAKARTATAAAPLMAPSPAHRVAARIGIPFTPLVACGRAGERCTLRYDLYRPVGRGPWPIVVVAPGGPTAPTGGGHLTDFARRLAADGAIVMVASWRQGDRYGGTVPRAFGDIGCALRTARSIASTVDGDAGRLVLLGHSLGGWGGAIVALDPAASVPLAGECLVRSGSARPAAFIGLAGAYAGPAGDRDDVDWVDLIGASRSAAPDRWQRADPLAIARRSGARQIPVLLIHGSADTGVAPSQTSRFATELRRAGRQPKVVFERGFTHMGILTAPATFTLIARLVDALPR